MKYVITSKQTGKNYLLDTEEELDAALATHVQSSSDATFTIREHKPDIDSEEIHEIHLKIIKDQSLCKDNV